MKKISFYFFLILMSGFIDFSCKKSETNSLDANNLVGCKLISISYTNWIDSIKYVDNKIVEVGGYEKKRLYMGAITKIKFEYLNNEIKVYNNTYLEQIISFKDSKISQIKGRTGDIYASYYYTENKLKYIMLGDLKGERDSMAIKYDSNGKNIIEMKNFSYNTKLKTYRLNGVYKYEFDDKINPLSKSIYFINEMYEEYELSLDYFNTNNITLITSVVSDIGWGDNSASLSSYTYNDKGLPVNRELIDGNYFERTDYSYKCD